MMLPNDVNVWPEFWKHLYEERVTFLQYDGTFSKKQAEIEAKATLRRIAEAEEEQWYESEAEAEKRYEAILELEAIRSIRDRGRLKAAHPTAIASK